MDNNETNKLLEEILKWIKIIGSEFLTKKVKEKNLFMDKKHILIYYYSDGKKSSRDIGKLVNISHASVQDLWKKWISAGIAEPSKKYKGGRCRRNFELYELGLEIPKEE